MKVFIVLSIFVGLSWAGCENLAKLEACNRPEGDCSCEAGLTCVLTKKVILDKDGSTKLIKQCMPDGEEIDVETVDLDNEEQEADSSAVRAKRFLFSKRCSTQEDCGSDKCCAGVVKRCLPKIRENGSCNFSSLHKCGCADGLVCEKTTDISILPGIKFALKQCVRM
ncbi:uncharacterized protein LOC144629220 [Oculina patagonica]